MNNIPYLVRRRLLPPCSPEEHRRRRLTVLHAVLRCREKFGRSRIGTRTTLYWSGEACQNYVMVKTNFVMVKTTCRPVLFRLLEGKSDARGLLRVQCKLPVGRGWREFGLHIKTTVAAATSGSHVGNVRHAYGPGHALP